MQALGPVVFVEVQRDLAVGFRPEAMTTCLEVAAHALEVVELAVDDDVDRAVFIRDWLVAGREVDDRQSRVAECGASIIRHPVLLAIGAAMVKLRHAGEHRVAVDWRMAGEDGGNSAHGWLGERRPATKI
jgi:hypothetical protein